MVCRQANACGGRKIHSHDKLKPEGSRGEIRSDLIESILSRKPSSPLKQRRPYRKPTLVGGGKCPKVIEITLVKELGNLAP